MYYSEKCPNCSVINYWCGGDPNDLSGTDADGLKCWSCGKEWVFEECKDWGIDLNNARIVDGEKKI